MTPTLRTGAHPVPSSLAGRFVISLGRLLSAGCVLLGVALLVLMVLAPQLGATATGPGWTRTGWHLGVGLVADIGQFAVRARPWPVRVAAGLLAVVAVLVLLAVSWWS